MNINIAQYTRRLIVAATLFVVACCGVSAHEEEEHSETYQRLWPKYVEAYKNYDNARGVALSDSLFHAAMDAGMPHLAIRFLTVQIKYECNIDSNYAAVDRIVNRVLKLAEKYNYVEMFYSAVSFRVTYFINNGKYDEALSYQSEMLKYAKQHGHYYGMVIGHVSLGNFHRKRLSITQAIYEYEQAIEAYRKYSSNPEIGSHYIRIAECYVVVGNFEKAVEAADMGLKYDVKNYNYCGLNAYKAFAQFMLDRDSDFEKSYELYMSDNSIVPNVQMYVRRCLEVMKLMHDGKMDEAEKEFTKDGMGAFKQYVEMAYYKRRGEYAKVLNVMRRLNISLYGNSKGSFIADIAQFSAEINNNLTDLDRQRAAIINKQLEYVRTSLDVKAAELELAHSKNDERIALMDAEAQRLSVNNQRLVSQRLRDSLVNQQLHCKALEEESRSGRVMFYTLFGVIAVLTLLIYQYMRRNIRMTRMLKETNGNLQHTLDELQVANEYAQESDRKKTEFIQNMSHEVRTPLNAIVGFSQVLTEQENYLSDEERRNMVHIINANSEILSTLVDEILDMTSVESGRYAINIKPVHVNELCHQVLDSTRHHKSDGVHLLFETNLPDDYTISTDHYRVHQVLTHLLTNAMKNTTQGSVVLGCSLTERPGMLVFYVRDTGIGVPKDKYDAIFERFCKLDEFKQGVGLGLNLCRVIANKLGGEVDIDPKYTDGARFWFMIPLS